jgi:cytosolic carboxypeptidase protein 2/3
VLAIKEEIRRLSVEEEVVSCFDLHSHSKDYNIFAYCCKTDNQGRILPFLLSRMTNMFNFPCCTFGVSKYKETTARAVIYNITRAPDVLTIESSFYGFNNPFKVLTPSSFITFATALIKALKHFYSRDREC